MTLVHGKLDVVGHRMNFEPRRGSMLRVLALLGLF